MRILRDSEVKLSHEDISEVSSKVRTFDYQDVVKAVLTACMQVPFTGPHLPSRVGPEAYMDKQMEIGNRSVYEWVYLYDEKHYPLNN